MPGPWRAFPLAVALLSAGCALLPGGARHADINGVRIVYRVHGHGPKLLLLHGGGGQSLGLARQILDFGRHFTVIAPDSRGHGGSTDDGDTLSYHVMAEDMVALLDVLHLDRVSVMGWSDGAIVGLDLAIHHPGRVRKLVLFGANFTPEGVNPAVYAALHRAWAEDSTAAAADLSEPLPFDARLRHLWLTQPHFTLGELHSIECPTLVAVGDHDLPRLEHTIALAGAIPHSQLCVIPGATHAVLHERADLADEIVLQFLKVPIRPGVGTPQM
jgi:pimeloyl-ACP methyl ester carboxylesterase